MSFYTEQVNIKMYLEGIEVPIASAQIQESMGMPPTCTVNIGTRSYGTKLLAGTLMHLFYNDQLVFEGELQRVQLIKNVSSKAVSLVFVGLSNIFDRAFLYSTDFRAASMKNKAFFISNPEYAYGTPEAERNKVFLNTQEKESIIAAEKKLKEAEEQQAALRAAEQVEAIRAATPNILGALPSNQTATTLPNSPLLPLTQPATPPREQPKRFQAIISRLGGPVTSLIAKLDQISSVESMIDTFIALAASANNTFNRYEKAYQLRKRVYVFPNDLAKPLLKAVNFRMAILQAVQSDVDDIMSLRKILAQICEYVGYEMVELAAPVWVGGDPKSIIFKPKMFLMPPALPNIVFPNQFSTINTDHNMMQEPTRYSCVSTPILFSAAPELANGYFLATAPKMALAGSPSNGYSMSPTDEELWRGLKPAQEPQPDYLAQTYAELSNQGELTSIANNLTGANTPVDTLSDIDFEKLQNKKAVEQKVPVRDLTAHFKENPEKGSFATHMQEVADRRFFELRASSKVGSATTIYSPFRVLGFPGAIISDPDELPTIAGVFSTITSVFDANGSVAQTITVQGYKTFVLDNDYASRVSNYDDFYPTQINYYDEGYSVEKVGSARYAVFFDSTRDSAITYFANPSSGPASLAKGTGETNGNYAIRVGLYEAIREFNKSSYKHEFSETVIKRPVATSDIFWRWLLTAPTDLRNSANKHEHKDLSTDATKKPFHSLRQERVISCLA